MSEIIRESDVTHNGKLFDAANVDNIPAELKALRQWLNWKFAADRTGKITKVPISPHGGAGNTKKPSTWSTFDHALVQAKRSPRRLGLGFVFNQPTAPYFGLDLDHVGEDANRLSTDEAQAILTQARGTYAETSPSRTGYHIIGIGTVTEACKTQRGELYGWGRYFTITGALVAGHPTTIASYDPTVMRWLEAQIHPHDTPRTGRSARATRAQSPTLPPSSCDQAIITQLLFKAKNHTKMHKLWAGEWRELGYASSSEAHAACYLSIGFYAGERAAWIARIFQQSPLYAASKWAERNDLEADVARVLNRYSPIRTLYGR